MYVTSNPVWQLFRLVLRRLIGLTFLLAIEIQKICIQAAAIGLYAIIKLAWCLTTNYYLQRLHRDQIIIFQQLVDSRGASK